MLVYPKPGVLVRDPEKRDLIPVTGREVSPHDPYWARRLADGDVTTDVPTGRAPSRATGKGPAPNETANGSNDA